MWILMSFVDYEQLLWASQNSFQHNLLSLIISAIKFKIEFIFFFFAHKFHPCPSSFVFAVVLGLAILSR